jgi:hypothetical protein
MATYDKALILCDSSNSSHWVLKYAGLKTKHSYVLAI